MIMIDSNYKFLVTYLMSFLYMTNPLLHCCIVIALTFSNATVASTLVIKTMIESVDSLVRVVGYKNE